MSLRIIFMGTPDFSVPTLRALCAAGHDVVACYTQPPRPAGRRGLEVVPSPVQKAAEELGIAVFTPVSLKDDKEQQIFRDFNADVAVVVAYGLLLPKAILEAPVHGCFNGHASLLPRWRGAAPIQRAIMAGDTETGMMIMKMDEGLDTGPVALEERVPIHETTTANMLHDELSALGADLMVKAMAALEDGSLSLRAQSEEGVEYAAKISKQEARINWAQDASQVHRHIMGLSPFPGAWCEIMIGGKLTRVKVLESKVLPDVSEQPDTIFPDGLRVACSEGAVELLRVQKAGSKAVDGAEFMRGNPPDPGTRLS